MEVCHIQAGIHTFRTREEVTFDIEALSTEGSLIGVPGGIVHLANKKEIPMLPGEDMHIEMPDGRVVAVVKVR